MPVLRNRLVSLLQVVLLLAGCAAAPAEEKVLFEKQSKYSLVTVTEDEQGLRTLAFDKNSVRQSVAKPGDPDHLELHYARVVPVGMVIAEKPRRALMIGLGGGTVPIFLHKHFPDMAIDVVDIDPVVVEVARKFFGFRDDETLRAHVGDGRRFIETCRDPYDIIFLDAFSSENIPRHLATREFLQAVRKALTPQGIVVGNIWGRGSNVLYDAMALTYLDVFEEVYIFDVPDAGNKIVVALPRKQQLDRDKLARQARQLSREKQWRFDLGQAVLRGYSRVGPDDFRGEVLTDAGAAKEEANR
jgi:spermidine synthase